MELEKYSIGIGDRFGHQGKAQLNAVIKAQSEGIDLVPVWNKSFREHQIVGSKPEDVRIEADNAVKELNWKGTYLVDADHINLKNVDEFISSSDFFTIDVADYIGNDIDDNELQKIIKKFSPYIGNIALPQTDQPLSISEQMIIKTANQFYAAVKEAGKIYRYIESVKGTENFITEVSIDESARAQTPAELFYILGMIAEEQIPAQTIAPKFTGQFYKGIVYVGDVDQFAEDFNINLAVLKFAVKEFDLPSNMKLSIHSGSDKFNIYEPVKKSLNNFNAGLHLKTAGTTWLEELIGLALSDEEEGLLIVKNIYHQALSRFDELCAPYSMVIKIDKNKLPPLDIVEQWNGKKYASALIHDPVCKEYNPHFRQLMHVAYKIAAEMGSQYLNALEKYKDIIAENVTNNLYERHIKPIFVSSQNSIVTN